MRQTVLIAKEFGLYLIGRGIGANIRKAYFKSNPAEWPILDFTGVAQATESALDEMFGTLARECGVDAVRSIRIEGASDQVRETIEYVFSLIEKPPAAPTSEKIRELLGRNFRRARQRKKARA